MKSIFSSFYYDLRINTAVMFGVLCAAAVLTGALLVGDSMRGSLKALTLDRLGAIDTILFAPNFIDENSESSAFAVPVIYLSGAAEYNGKTSSTQILALPKTNSFTSQSVSFAVNQTLADKLQLKDGEELSLRFLSPQSIPPESTFGKKDNLIRTKITVDKVIQNIGIGRFSLKADQQAEPLLIVPLEFLQAKLDAGKKVNAVFYLGDLGHPDKPLSVQQRNEFIKEFKPSLADLGISLNHSPLSAALTSKRLLFTDKQVKCLTAAVKQRCDTGLLYLATSIKAAKSGSEVPYSTVFAVSSAPLVLGLNEPLVLGLNEIALNEWTANDLKVQISDEIELTWFEPDNVNVTKSQKFTLTKIIPNDIFTNEVVPKVKGFTDENSIADWDPPFPFDAKKIRKKDEDYWDKYRAAPKAVVCLETGQKLWGSRFGNVSTLFINREDLSSQTALQTALQAVAANNLLTDSLLTDNLLTFNLNFVPVKEQGLAASLGTTPFSVLFVCFSFFIIASALMLVMLLFRLSVEMKAKQIGIRLACGWAHRQVLRLLLAEGFVLALTGSFFGVLFGILYAQLMIYGLTTLWVEAVAVPFLKLYVNPLSLLIGFTGGTLSAMLMIILTLRSSKRIPVRTLLGGDYIIPLRQSKKNVSAQKTAEKAKENKKQRFIAYLGFLDFQQRPVLYLFMIAGMFFVQAAAIDFLGGNHIIFFIFAAGLLVLSIRIFSQLLRQYDINTDSLAGLSRTNITRNWGRSVLCAGLIASTVFLVLSVSVFRLDPQEETEGDLLFRGSGSGGFDYIAETAFPTAYNINTPEGRAELGIQQSEEELFLAQRIDIVPIRATGGDNAGCLNLYQTGNPRILGVPCRRLLQQEHPWQLKTSQPKILRSGGKFRFAAPERKLYESSPWSDLSRSVSVDSDGIKRVPVILDQNTAMYSFHLYKGIGEVYELPYNNETLRCEVVGLLNNSILQGEIIMSEENLLQLFPDVSGYKYFLITHHEVPKVLYNLLGDYGVQIESTKDRLRNLFAVQNTYLSAFQSLGSIGLLLGVFGLAVIQVRNVLERRKELALFTAIGFRKSRIILMLLYENLYLLYWGLLLAVFAAFFALFPYFFGSSQELSFTSALRQFVQLAGGMFIIGIVSNIAASLSVLKIPAAKELAEER